jgi:hypothetical protein
MQGRGAYGVNDQAGQPQPASATRDHASSWKIADEPAAALPTLTEASKDPDGCNSKPEAQLLLDSATASQVQNVGTAGHLGSTPSREEQAAALSAAAPTCDKPTYLTGLQGLHKENKGCDGISSTRTFKGGRCFNGCIFL